MEQGIFKVNLFWEDGFFITLFIHQKFLSFATLQTNGVIHLHVSLKASIPKTLGVVVPGMPIKGISKKRSTV